MPLTFWDGPHCLCGVFLSKETHFLPITLSLTEVFLQWDIKNLSFIKSWDQMCELSCETVCSSPNLSCTFAVGILTQACWIPKSKHGTTSCHLLVIPTSHISLETSGWKKENRFLYSKLFRFHIDSFVQSIVSEFVVNTLGIKGRQRWRPLQYKHSGDHHYPTTESQKPNLAAQPHFLGTSDLHYNELKCLQARNHFPEILGKRLNLFSKLLSPKLRICFQLWDGFLRSRTE